MAPTRRDVLASVPLVVATTGCSAIPWSSSQPLWVRLHNVSGSTQQLEYTITNGETTLATTSLRVTPTSSDYPHHTIEINETTLQKGDTLQMDVALPSHSEQRLAELTVDCSGDCKNWFTIRITEGTGLEVSSGSKERGREE